LNRSLLADVVRGPVCLRRWFGDVAELFVDQLEEVVLGPIL
jgi:hypothetical protein